MDFLKFQKYMNNLQFHRTEYNIFLIQLLLKNQRYNQIRQLKNFQFRLKECRNKQFPLYQH